MDMAVRARTYDLDALARRYKGLPAQRPAHHIEIDLVRSCSSLQMQISIAPMNFTPLLETSCCAFDMRLPGGAKRVPAPLKAALLRTLFHHPGFSRRDKRPGNTLEPTHGAAVEIFGQCRFERGSIAGQPITANDGLDIGNGGLFDGGP
jgi:hypothetical protein